MPIHGLVPIHRGYGPYTGVRRWTVSSNAQSKQAKAAEAAEPSDGDNLGWRAVANGKPTGCGNLSKGAEEVQDLCGVR